MLSLDIHVSVLMTFSFLFIFFNFICFLHTCIFCFVLFCVFVLFCFVSDRVVFSASQQNCCKICEYCKLLFKLQLCNLCTFQSKIHVSSSLVYLEAVATQPSDDYFVRICFLAFQQVYIACLQYAIVLKFRMHLIVGATKIMHMSLPQRQQMGHKTALLYVKYAVLA